MKQLISTLVSAQLQLNSISVEQLGISAKEKNALQHHIKKVRQVVEHADKMSGKRLK